MSEIYEAFPYLRVRGAAQAIDFYCRAFGGVERFRLTEPSGRIGHAEITFGPATIMLSDEFPEHGLVGPAPAGRSSFAVHLHVADVDKVFERAVREGASVIRPLENHFYGERSGTVQDPFGHEWLLGGQIEALTPEEMQRRYTALFQQ
ncbi:VOC family protein [Trinickia sp. EG282A]|uniref:VOC family protein n=1 Tax=Trinickia sp. EG282A TaxID=3237013 RepID=UPI0034D376DB